MALPALDALAASTHDVVAVVTRPDAAVGRSKRLVPSPVAQRAEELGIDVLKPNHPKDPDFVARLTELAPECCPVVAYGAILPAHVLAIPTHGWVNLHFSLLPAWRGAAPAQRAVLAGQDSTGMSVFRIAEGLDTGDVIATSATPIGATETSGQLLDRMAVEGAPLLLRALDELAAGTANFTPQDDDLATRAAKLTPAEARVDWRRPAAEVSAHLRGMSPDPGAWSLLEGQRVKLHGVGETPAGDLPALAPGQLHPTKRALLVGTGTTPLALDRLSPPGKREMAAVDWARGAGLAPGTAFETFPEHPTQETA